MVNDQQYMQRALALARAAQDKGEVPVGAIIVLDDEIVAEGFNCPISTHDPSAHAEMIVLRRAALKFKNYRLPQATLYVTLEPCVMCAGAMIHARVRRCVFGAYDKKSGAAGSVLNIFDEKALNHRVIVEGGVLAEACSELLSTFFQSRRS
ncbi:MAG: tRNA adenosine(34) deaminase TadA [Pseudomonadota bacterium]